ncbi:MAG: hypothetical protein H6833_06105 [Planctomycetes bacterium]|nr:hypothetical protein [Planctomycetota bacterium]
MQRTLPSFLAILTVAPLAIAQVPPPPGEGPALGKNRITQAQITGGVLSLDDIRAAGLLIFSTPFNKHDGFGDGPMNPSNTTGFGGRPTLQNNGTFLRVNGLDSQTCMECHSVGSNATVPFTFAVGGVGGSNNNAMFQPREIDVDASSGAGYAFYDGRFINPPFLFGSGGVELVGKEMTSDLQRLKRRAERHPGTTVRLITKGVDFGSVVFDANSQTFDTSQVVGVDADLVVRPFGRKGEFISVRAFDVDAMQFHLGMQPVEAVGVDVDADRDGIMNELLVGEISALHVFNTNLERPEVRRFSPAAQAGLQVFETLGCADCHVPELRTESRVLRYAFPEVPEDPSANVFYATDLSKKPAGFDRIGGRHGNGIRVPMFSDLKRHDMGPGLAESFGRPLDTHFITARLWGVADTAPYLHDGRALTLTDAILAHGGEAQSARDAFDNLNPMHRQQVLAFLRSLRTPRNPAADLLRGQDDDLDG